MIICTCGHKVQDFAQTHQVITKGYNRRGDACLDYKTVCDDCYATEERFETEVEALIWLHEQCSTT